VLPPSLVPDVVRAKLHADRGSSAFEQLTFADFLNRGELDRHLRRTRPIYRRRRDALVTALNTRLRRFPIQGIAAGLHFMIELERGLDEETVVAAAARRSVRVYAARTANPRKGPPALLVGYGGIPESAIPEGVAQLAAAIAHCR
jgi:GntR family transcriptional regulator/MocR family aminotransferase